jgi:hypothetical protein
MSRRRVRRHGWARMTIASAMGLAGCYQLAGDDEPAPVASAIPQAAHSAIGADYPGPSAVAAGHSTGLPGCDEYFKKIAGCKGLPPSTQKALQDAADQMRQTIKESTAPEARTAIEQACKQAAEALTMCDTQL